MLINYLQTAFRTFGRHKSYTSINVLGLAIGIACFLLIVLYIRGELNYDQYHEQANQIYRVLSDLSPGERHMRGPQTEGALAPALVRAFPEILDAARIFPSGPRDIKYQNEIFRDLEGFYAEGNLYNIFSFELIRGNAASVLVRPHTIVLTESLAKKIFDEEDAIGKSLLALVRGEFHAFEVTGVMKDIPDNSHFTVDFLISLETLSGTRISTGWGAFNFWTYVLLPEGYAPTELEGKLPSFVKEKYGEERANEWKLRYELQPLTDIYFSSEYAPNQGERRYAYLFSIIAVLILLSACANYMNLATARATSRTLEVGIRKSLGAHRSQLVRQFLGESMLVTLLALLLALVLLALFLPTFSALAGRDIGLGTTLSGFFLLTLFGVVMLVGLVAGSYPAFFLSLFKPVEVLRGRLGTRLSGSGLRKGLIIFQFTVSIALIFSTVVVERQLSYMQSAKLGFDASHLVVISLATTELARQVAPMKEEFSKLPDVLQTTASDSVPGKWFGSMTSPVSLVGAEEGTSLHMAHGFIDHDFLEVLHLELVAGRGFSEEVTADAVDACILNETAVRALGWATAEEALGQRLSVRRSERTVVGVVQDFHFKSLHQKIEPVVMLMKFGNPSTILVRIASEDIPVTLKYLEGTWAQFAGELPFTFFFLDEAMDALYRSEERIGKLLFIFMVLALFIAALGLFGLASFTTEQRTKEIGIRKVMGASAFRIVLLLTKDLAKLVGVSFAIATPVTYFAMNQWLSNYAYRTTIGADMIVVIGLLALMIALAAVSWQTIRVASANPVTALRYE